LELTIRTYWNLFATSELEKSADLVYMGVWIVRERICENTLLPDKKISRFQRVDCEGIEDLEFIEHHAGKLSPACRRCGGRTGSS